MLNAVQIPAGVAGIELPEHLEYFEEPDQILGQGIVPVAAQAYTPNLGNVTNADMVLEWSFDFLFSGTFNAYTGTLNASPYFPYNFLQNMAVPFQNGNLQMQQMDGHATWLMSLIRNRVRPYKQPAYVGQAGLLATGYSVEANAVSSASYVPAASTAKTYKFRLPVSPALWFDHFYDVVLDSKGNAMNVRYDDVYVQPLMMSGTGRNISPKLTTLPLFGARLDQAVFVQSGTLTTPPTWTDGGSVVTVRRRGYRQPVDASFLPPVFPWVRQVEVMQNVPLGTTTAIPLNADGQLLSVWVRMFDPTLASGIGGPIPLANLNAAQLTYGSGLVKFNDSPSSIQERLWNQWGVTPTEGCFCWDMYADKRSNADCLNTYDTANPRVIVDLTGNTPGAGSYATVITEYLTKVNAQGIAQGR